MLLIERALQGKDVVRLKGGDPFVFGRGGEEALVCREFGIPFEVVPGVSSAFAVPAYAGIPLTQRRVSSAFTVIAGHEDPTKGGSSINYEAVAKLGGAIVILMGVKNLPSITRQLIEKGLDAGYARRRHRMGRHLSSARVHRYRRAYRWHRPAPGNHSARHHRHRRSRAPARSRRGLV